MPGSPARSSTGGPCPARWRSSSASSRCRPTNGGVAASGRAGAAGAAVRSRRAAVRECGMLLGRQPKRLRQERNGVLARRLRDAALHVADTTHAHAGTLGQFLLRQPGGDPLAPEQRAESSGLYRVHGSSRPLTR